MIQRPQTERILGIEFFAGSLPEVHEKIRRGGLLVAPSAPGLADAFMREPTYRVSLLEADVVLTDSSFLVLLWALRGGGWLPRHSGLAWLRWYLADQQKAVEKEKIFWIMPGVAEMQRNLVWLCEQGLPTTAGDCYVAPAYGSGEIVDEALCAAVERARPDVVVIAIGGGVQERLGHFLKRRLAQAPKRPGIFCLGAAIAFLTGGQVRIPVWVDRGRMGWLWRIASRPSVYGPRYWRALRLGWLVLQHGRSAPPVNWNHPRALGGSALQVDGRVG